MIQTTKKVKKTRSLRLLLLLLAMLLCCTACAGAGGDEYDDSRPFLEAIGFTEMPVDEQSPYRLYHYSGYALLLFDEFTSFQSFYVHARENGMERILGIAPEKVSGSFEMISVHNKGQEFPPYNVNRVSFQFQKPIGNGTVKYSFEPEVSLFRQNKELNPDDWDQIELSFKHLGMDSSTVYYQIGYKDESSQFMSVASVSINGPSLSTQDMEAICAELMQAIVVMN